MDTFTYGFFDYKYNIEGYSGQHYGSIYQTVYLIAALVLAFALAFLLRNVKKETIKKVIGYIGIAMTVFYVVKTVWESHYDVATGRGFNTYLLPFDTCSIIMWSCLIAGFGKGWFADWAAKWTCVYGFVGGFANALFLRGLNYYPFWTFGAFYSMIWHAVMIFCAWWLLFSGYCEFKWYDIFRAFGFHMIFSVLPIVINTAVRRMDWMLYDTAGGVPLVEGIVEPYANTFTGTLIMILAYFLIGAALSGLYILGALVVKCVKKCFCAKKTVD